MLLGSFAAELASLQAANAAEASLRLPGFEYEAARAAQRRRAGAGSTGATAAAAAAATAGMQGAGHDMWRCRLISQEGWGACVIVWWHFSSCQPACSVLLCWYCA
jgi:hypothetical protein